MMILFNANQNNLSHDVHSIAVASRARGKPMFSYDFKRSRVLTGCCAKGRGLNKYCQCHGASSALACWRQVTRPEA